MMPGFVPVNHSVAEARAAARLDVENLPEAPSADVLDNITQENYELDLETSASLGFPVLTIAAGYKRQVLLHGTSEWLDVTQGDHTYRFGAAVRVIVNVSTITGTAELTLPAIAAKVELNEAFAAAQLLVRGYKGLVTLPAWNSFGVESFADYKQQVSALETQVFGDRANIVPELLATTVNSLVAQVAPSAPASVGSIIALHGIAGGFNRAHTLENLHERDDALVQAVHAVYAARIGDDLLKAPDEDQKVAARNDLHGIQFAPEILEKLKLHR